MEKELMNITMVLNMSDNIVKELKMVRENFIMATELYRIKVIFKMDFLMVKVKHIALKEVPFKLIGFKE